MKPVNSWTVLQFSTARCSPTVPGIPLPKNLAPLPSTGKVTTTDAALPLSQTDKSMPRSTAVSEFHDEELDEAWRELPDDLFRQTPTPKVMMDRVHWITHGLLRAEPDKSDTPTLAGDSDFEDKEFEEACEAVISSE